jgi:hypothetical protein
VAIRCSRFNEFEKEINELADQARGVQYSAYPDARVLLDITAQEQAG